MKFKHKKIIISGIAVTLAGVLGVGMLLDTSVAVQASAAMMPGIETIINEASKEDPFRILEIVDDVKEAEIGYYVSGQEPYIKLYEYTPENGDTPIHFSTMVEGLSKLPTKKLREEFAKNVKINEDGTVDENGSNLKNVMDVSYREGKEGDEIKDYPLSYSEYQEKYFLTQEDNLDEWTRVDFNTEQGEKRTDKISGHYQENPAGTGDYSKQEQSYYPIRHNVEQDGNQPEKFRENIQNFYFSEGNGASAPYYLVFDGVQNDTVNSAIIDENDQGQKTILPEYDYANGRYGYYEKVYADLTTEMTDNIAAGNYTFPGEPEEEPVVDNNAVLLQTNEPLTLADTFTSGDEEGFSDSEDEAGDVFGIGAEPENIEFQQTTDIFSSEESFSSEMDPASDFAGNGAEDIPEIQAKFLNEETKGTQSNPYIYYGEMINVYPNYHYTLIGDLEYVLEQAGLNENKDQEIIENDGVITRTIGDITRSNGQYWYWVDAGNGTGECISMPLSIVTGMQPVAYSDVRVIDESIQYNYYYRVKSVYFCCRLPEAGDVNDGNAYEYFGWYYPSYPQNQDIYIPVEEGRIPTHYISEAEYKLTPGIGNYDFIPGENEGDREYIVELDHLFYQGGYTNHDWLKRYVFNLSPESSDDQVRQQFEIFNIKVETFNVNEFENGFAKIAEANSMQELEDSANNEQPNLEDNLDDVSNMPDESLNIIDDVELDTVDNSEEPDDADIFDDEQESFVEPMVSESIEKLDTFGSVIDENGTNNDILVDKNKEENEVWSDDAESNGLTEANGYDMEFSDSAEGEENLFVSDGETLFTVDEEAQNSLELSQYDLIYINGNLNEQSAKEIAASGVPCIINQDKAISKDGVKTGIEIAFASYLKTDEEDQHYVNQNVYFFNDPNKKDNDSGISELINLQFAKPFYSEEPGVTDGELPPEAIGFEEIINYIHTENDYRTATVQGSDNEDDKLLKVAIYQARIIEYILNYKYKRSITVKSEIDVLEIQPASKKGQLTKEEVLRWIIGDQTVEFENPTCCCQHPDNPVQYIIDGNNTTFWHNDWSQNDGKRHKTPWIQVEIKGNSSLIKGITYTPRQNNSNGRAIEYRVEILDRNKNILQSYEGTFKNANYTKQQEIKFSKDMPSTAAYIKFNFVNPMRDEKGKIATCAELGIIFPEVNIYPMTASEYVGHIEDINSKYDIIYIGDDTADRNSLINGNEPMLYTHVGAAVKANDIGKVGLMGMLDSDYNIIQNPVEEKISVNGNTITVKRNKRVKSTQLYNTGEKGGETFPGLGSFRGSGNDITNQQYKELLDFVNSGYPVVLGDSLINDGVIDESYVDNSSYYYKFMNAVKEYANVLSKSDLDNKKSSIAFFSNLEKPKIDFLGGQIIPEPPRVGETIDASNGIDYLDGEGLIYKFTVRNESEISPASATYDCKLFLDLNFDGNLSNLEEQSKYIEIRDSSGKVLTQTDKKYHLKIGEQYTVFRKIPEDYYKIITWELQVVSNVNESVRTSVIGYAKRKNNAQKQEINVLQIMPDKGIKGNTGHGTWNLNTNNKFKTLVGNVEDFEIIVDAKTVSDYENNPSLLDNKQMLIIGFDDVVQNISNDNHQVDKIIDFVKAGKSVIFSHDTTSKLNWDYRETYPNTADPNSVSLKDNWIWERNRADWGLSLNKYFRPLAGLDRYGITDNESKINDKGDITISELLKQGNMLTDGESVIVNGNKECISFKKLMEMAGDVAFTTSSGRKTSYMQTQGYTNSLITKGFNANETSKVTKVNEGAITQYPYRMGDEIPVADTHIQYYQLALEKDRDINGVSDGKNDIVVWYCLSGNEYSKSPNDVRNNYYFYSRGNVIYTGVGHSNVNGDDEVKLFINAIVAAANVTAVQPEVNFIKSLNPAAEKESVRYYMTDQYTWLSSNTEERNLLEKDMGIYFNVKDYNMVSASLSEEDQNSTDMKVEFFIQDENGTVQDGAIDNEPTRSITMEIDKLFPYGDEENPINRGDDNVFHLQKNNAFKFYLPDVENYVNDDTGQYKSTCKLYVKITSVVTLYGVSNEKTSWAVLDLKQRQLFDLD